MIGAIVSLFNGGLETYRQYNSNKAEALKRKDDLDQEKHQARVRRLQKGEEQASSLDEVSIRERGFKDEFILLVVFIPLILSFIPDYATYVEQGFEALQNIPEPYWYVVGAVAICLSYCHRLLAGLAKLLKFKAFSSLFSGSLEYARYT